MPKKQYLLAAEADQIQDLIFRSSRLREVVGGSQLLTRFCQKVPELLLQNPAEQVIVRDGGSFRVDFDDRGEAVAFGDKLAEVYRLATGGSLTVARPVEYEEGGFRQASEEAEYLLREAKRRQAAGTAPVQMPYVAYCASCGVGLAETHEKAVKDDPLGQYVCRFCRAKRWERKDNLAGAFLEPFLRLIDPKLGPGGLIWPGKIRDPETGEKEPTEEVAESDRRRYVAYLLADGNNMGKVFSQCNKDDMRYLSQKMTHTLRACLAEATMTLKKEVGEFDPDVVPVLPLILGGDDLFALLPAPWAVHFAAEFCRAYEEQVSALVKELLADKANLPTKMTCGAVVVICKCSYPYRLAHEAGEERLKEAKRLSKVLAAVTSGQSLLSTIDFEVVLGSQLVQGASAGDFRSTLRPFWVGQPPQGWGHSVWSLLDARYEMRTLPGKRRSQLRALFAPDQMPRDGVDVKRWEAERDALLERIGLSTGRDYKRAWEHLGGKDLVSIDRLTEAGLWQGSAAPDMLDAWECLLDMTQHQADYKEA